MNGSLPENSDPLLITRNEPLVCEAKMPDAQLSKAPSVSYREFQLDILTKLAVPTGYFVEISHGRMAQLVDPTVQVIKLPVHEYLK